MRIGTKFGLVNPNQTLENSRIFGVGTVYYNLSTPALVELSVRRGEGTVGPGWITSGFDGQMHGQVS